MSTPISLQALLASLASGPVGLVEALGADFYACGHLPGAVNLPLSSTDIEIEALLPSLRRPIVVYGTRRGGEAAELAHRIEAVSGHDVSVLTGGKESWAEAGHPLERRMLRSAER